MSDFDEIPTTQTDVKMLRQTPSRLLALASIAASALLLGTYARGGYAWPLGFFVLVPWLLTLHHTRTLVGALASGWLMSVAFVLAVFAWFGTAVGTFTGVGTPVALLLSAVLAPLLQPQVLVFGLVRHLAGRRHGVLVQALAGACAWVACEWSFPKLLGDTLGHGLGPSIHLRQVADLGGAAGITVLVILVNEALALAVMRWREGTRSWLPPLMLAALVPASMAVYGTVRLAYQQAEQDVPIPYYLRIGMVQSGLVDYERMRRELGTFPVVRKILDTHFALSRAAIEQHGVDALLWSETVYPTTFSHPRSADGAAFDREILDFVRTAGVSLVFGTYDIDAGGEYNAAAFIDPSAGLLGFYRKTHPFPLTEHVPAWLDGPFVRNNLPWTGNWQAGSGARVFPLRAKDGRELQVVPLICLDDVRPQLAIDGARLGAQAIIGLSNDSWFSASPHGARLHLTVASFRSIETRMSQLRVTTNGLSAYIDPTGEVVVSTAMGDQAVLAGELPAVNPPLTLMVRWGDWVGGAALALLLMLGAGGVISAWSQRRATADVTAPVADGDAEEYAADVALLTPAWRWACALLRMAAGAGLATLFLLMLTRDGLQVNSLSQIQLYAWAVVAPLIAAWAIQRAFAASARVENGMLVVRRRAQRIEIPITSIAFVRVWRLPLPGIGIDLHFVSGRRWPAGIQLSDPDALVRALKPEQSEATAIAAMAAPTIAEQSEATAIAGMAAPTNASPHSVQFDDTLSKRLAHYAAARAAATHRWLDHPLAKFGLFPLVPALPAFRLHQHIAFGGTFGEYHTYGLGAWLLGLLIWWLAWSIGLMLFAASLRIISETATLLVLWRRPQQAAMFRRRLQWLLRLAFYLGVPLWLLVRIVSG